jgi:hypothetical protein
MEIDPPAFVPSTYARQPMDVDSPAILPLFLARQERMEVTQTILPPIHPLTLEEPVVVDLNREIQPADIVDLPNTRPYDAVPIPIVQPIENVDAEVVVPTNWEDHQGEPQLPSVITPTTLDGGLEVIDVLDGRRDEFYIANAGRLLHFKDCFLEDLSERMQRLKIADDPSIPELSGPASVPSVNITGIPPTNTNGVTDVIHISELPSTLTPLFPSEDTTIATEERLDIDINDFTDDNRVPELSLPCSSIPIPIPTSTTSVPSVNTATPTS